MLSVHQLQRLHLALSTNTYEPFLPSHHRLRDKNAGRQGSSACVAKLCLQYTREGYTIANKRSKTCILLSCKTCCIRMHAAPLHPDQPPLLPCQLKTHMTMEDRIENAPPSSSLVGLYGRRASPLLLHTLQSEGWNGSQELTERTIHIYFYYEVSTLSLLLLIVILMPHQMNRMIKRQKNSFLPLRPPNRDGALKCRLQLRVDCP